MIRPRPLITGDKIAILSPASAINPDYVEAAASAIAAAGWTPVIYPGALGRNGTYSGSREQRLRDLSDALADPSVRAILCSRGGYGAVHLLDHLSRLPLADDPKWLIGFSDISALHALMQSKGIQSIHASMARQLAKGVNHPINQLLFNILRGQENNYAFRPHPYNRNGTATARLVGGNLAVLGGLIGTPYDLLQPDTLLFIEDIAEPIYKVERILYQLRLKGVLQRLKGLIVGRFTEYSPDANHPSMERMIADMTAPYAYPVAFNIPVGHIDDNIPLIQGSTVTLTVTPDETTLHPL